jgi:hypothetical protein
MGEYIPGAPVNDEARQRNGSLPGMGGIFNLVNLHVYHYAGNNPVKYVDPDGEFAIPWPLVIKALEYIIPALLGIFTAKAINDTKEYLDSRPDNSMVGAQGLLDTSPLLDAVPKELTVTESRKHHEDETYGKVENEIRARLGRKLHDNEAEQWHREMERTKGEKIKNGEVPKGERNPSLSEDELRDAARDSLDIEL